MALTKVKLIADGVIDVDHLAANHGITTDNIGEGTALYYTDARVSSYLTTNSYATEGYVTTAVSNLVDAAPSTLDTLNELAAALGDDPNFATTVTNSIATKLPLSGGNITGNFSVDTDTLFVDAANNNSKTDAIVLPKGTIAQRPAVSQSGYMRYNTENDNVEFYNGTNWLAFENKYILDVEYLVVAGGGGGDNGYGGGGGAGGYRSSVIGENSGGGASAENTLKITTNTTLTVTVGAGGTGQTNGSSSSFSTINSIGGGAGGDHATLVVADRAGEDGGSGGGGGGDQADEDGPGGSGTASQGYDGGSGFGFSSATPDYRAGGGGGGAGQAGQSASNGTGGNGGDGVQSSITGTSIYRAGGGGGSVRGPAGSPVPGEGGLGGGGNGEVTNDPDPVNQAGAANTGGGGGAGGSVVGSGGSGVVIIRYPKSFFIEISEGLTASTSTVGDFKVTTFTAGSDTIQFTV